MNAHASFGRLLYRGTRNVHPPPPAGVCVSVVGVSVSLSLTRADRSTERERHIRRLLRGGVLFWSASHTRCSLHRENRVRSPGCCVTPATRRPSTLHTHVSAEHLADSHDFTTVLSRATNTSLRSLADRLATVLWSICMRFLSSQPSYILYTSHSATRPLESPELLLRLHAVNVVPSIHNTKSTGKRRKPVAQKQGEGYFFLAEDRQNR